MACRRCRLQLQGSTLDGQALRRNFAQQRFAIVLLLAWAASMAAFAAWLGVR
jgi:hypothetical protein